MSSRSFAYWRECLLGAVTLAGIIVALIAPPIAQDPAYHAFADARTIAGVPNFWNVASNLGFALAGLWGLGKRNDLAFATLRPAYAIFCTAVVCVGFGSGYYHYAPSTLSLVWDRLPMAVAFMALFASVVADRLDAELGKALLWPLLVLGVASVLYWAWTERSGVGDLRAYALVQFLPVLLMPLMLMLCPGSDSSASWLWATFALYVVAKLTEHFDVAIYTALGLSGHSIKHLLSGLAVLFAIVSLLRIEGERSAPRLRS